MTLTHGGIDMALLEYLNKPASVPVPDSMNEDVSPAAPEGHMVSEIRPAGPHMPKPASMGEVIAPATPEQPNYADAIGQKGYYGFFKDFYRKPDLEKEEKITRRERALSLLGDIANLGGQIFASSKGARQFAPINSQVPKYNERLQRLRDAKRANDADYQNKSLSAIFKDYEGRRADDMYKRQQEAAKAAMEFKYQRDLTLKQIDQAFQVGMLDAKGKQALSQQAARAKDAKELAALNHKYRLNEIETKANGNNVQKGGGVRESLQDKNNNVWTRGSILSRAEARSITEAYGDGSLEKPINGEPDYIGYATKLINEGRVPSEILQARGFVQSKMETQFDKNAYKRGNSHEEKKPRLE